LDGRAASSALEVVEVVVLLLEVLEVVVVVLLLLRYFSEPTVPSYVLVASLHNARCHVGVVERK
jgi:hypothetical protein